MNTGQEGNELINPVSYLKSIAIALMLFHHLFLSSYIIEGNSWLSLFSFPKIEVSIASFGKICVGIFAFITGYFMCKSDKSKKLSYRISKIASLLKKYWLYCLIFLAIGVLLREPLPDLKTLLFNLFGFGLKVFDYGTGYICVCFAWYVSFYIALQLLLVPLLNYLEKHKFILQAFMMVAMVIFLNVLAGIVSDRVAEESYVLLLTNAVYEFTRYSLVVATGYWICEYSLFSTIWEKTSLRVRGVTLLSLPLTFVLYLKLPGVNGFYFTFIYTAIFIFDLLVILEYINKCLGKTKAYAGIREATNCLSTVSSDIWYLHGIFFTPLRTLQFVAYFPRVSLLIFLWVLVLCSGISVILNYCTAHVKNWLIASVRNSYDK